MKGSNCRLLPQEGVVYFKYADAKRCEKKLPFRLEVLVDRGFITEELCDKLVHMVFAIDNEMENLAKVQIEHFWELYYQKQEEYETDR